MTCPYCNSELDDRGGFGSLAYLRGEESRRGNIYRCPNHEGFESDEQAQEYLDLSGETLESLGLSALDEVACGSCVHHVSGSFYDYDDGNLREGYPC